MDRREPRVGGLVWYDATPANNLPAPYDGRNGRFAVLIQVLPSRVMGSEIAVVQDLRHGESEPGGNHTILTDRLHKAHWTFIGPVCLEWPRYPLRFVGT